LIRSLINEFFENYFQKKLKTVKKSIEEENDVYESNKSHQYKNVQFLASSMKLEEQKKDLLTELIDDISKFALFLSDLTITFYNLDKMRFNAITRINEPLQDLESTLITTQTLFNFYIKYFFSNKIY
jgi:cell division protein FtsB